jgi:hypothetical protein
MENTLENCFVVGMELQSKNFWTNLKEIEKIISILRPLPYFGNSTLMWYTGTESACAGKMWDRPLDML